MNRALRAAAVGVLLIAPVTLAACSSGQVNQTSSQARDKVGATAQVGSITVREAELAYPTDGSYPKGSDVVLNAAIINGSFDSDTLVSITGDGFTGVDVTGTGAEATFATGSAPTGATATDTGTSAAATTSATPTTGAGTTTGAATPTTEAPLPTEAPSSDVGIAIPGKSVVYLGQNAPHVTLTGLTQSLNAAQSLRMTFTFQHAGAVTLNVIVGGPSSPVPNPSTFNFEVPTKAVEAPNEVGGGAAPSQNSGNG